MADTDLGTLIRCSESGDSQAREQLFTVLYAELHSLAQRQLRRNSSMTLSPTTLLHETYLDMANRGSSGAFPDRARFLSYASRAMRGLIIDYYRSRSAQKRGGAFEITVLPTEVPEGQSDVGLERLSEAVDVLANIEPRLAQVVDLKFFCGLTFSEIGAALDMSERTIKRDWEKARILLQHELRES